MGDNIKYSNKEVWSVKEPVEKKPVNRRQLQAGIASISTGLLLMIIDHRKKIKQVVKEDIFNLSTFSYLFIITGGMLVAPLFGIGLDTSSLDTTRLTLSRNDDRSSGKRNRMFQFRLLNEIYTSDILAYEKLMDEIDIDQVPSTLAHTLRQLQIKEKEDDLQNIRKQQQDLAALVEADIAAGIDLHTIRSTRLRNGKLFVIDFNSEQVGTSQSDSGDSLDELISFLSDAVSFVLSVHRLDRKVQVMLRLTSPGGSVQQYGLAAAQILRLKKQGVYTTVCVDEIAASGGYLMAVCANRIVASPFSFLGSIGVVAELPNFDKVLKRYEVDYMVFTAGQYKRTVHPLAEVTEDGKAKFQQELEAIHDVFQSHIIDNRPHVNLTEVASGEAWLAVQAKQFGLIDDLQTSAQFIQEKVVNEKIDAVLIAPVALPSRGLLDNLLFSLSRLEGLVKGKLPPILSSPYQAIQSRL